MTLTSSRHVALVLPLALSACPDTAGTTTDQGPTTGATTAGSTAPTAGDSTSDGPATTSTATLDPASATTTTGSTTGVESSGQLDSTRGPDLTTDTTTTSTTDVSTSSDTDIPTLCGNGVLDDGESCDDGNADDLDLCRNDCTPGPSGQGLGFPLPPLLAGESLRCFTAIDGAFAPNPAPALVLGSYGWVENTDDFLTRARQFALPGVGQPQWTWSLESDAVEWLPVFEAATAANGDVVLAGPAWNQEVLSDGLGAFWLARLTAAGDLVWQFQYDDLHLQPFDLEIAPDGDIVVAGMILNIVSTSEVHRFTGDGALLWSAAQDPFDESPTQTSYHSLAVDADAVYVVGQRRDLTDDLPINYRVHLRALGSDGAPLWQIDRPPPAPVGVSVGGMALTGGKLVVSLSRHGIDDVPFEPLPGYSLLVFDTAGGELSWNDYSLPAPWRGGAGKLVAAEDGSVFLAGGAAGEGQSVQHVARVGPDGAVLWSKLAAGDSIRDALLAPDGRFYLLTEAAITSYDLNGSP